MFETWLPQRAVVGEEFLHGASPRDLEQRLLVFLRDNWSTSGVDLTLVDEKLDKVDSERKEKTETKLNISVCFCKSAAALFGALGGANNSSSMRASQVWKEKSFLFLFNLFFLKSNVASWCSVSVNKSDLPCLLLGLECRLGQAKRFEQIGLFCLRLFF